MITNVLLLLALSPVTTRDQADALTREFAGRIQMPLGKLRNYSEMVRAIPEGTKDFSFSYWPKGGPENVAAGTLEFKVAEYCGEVEQYHDGVVIQEFRTRPSGVKPSDYTPQQLATMRARCLQRAKSLVLPRLKAWPETPVVLTGNEGTWPDMANIVVPFHFVFKGIPLIDTQDGVRFTFRLEDGKLYEYWLSKRAKVTESTPKVEREKARDIALAFYKAQKAKADKAADEFKASASVMGTRLAYVVPSELYGYRPKFKPWEPEAQLGWAIRFGQYNLYVSATDGAILGGRPAR